MSFFAQSKKHIAPEFKSFETRAWADDQLLCGIDEVGRGCLAGPVVTAAVILPPYTAETFLKDSKQMSASAREHAYTWITTHCQYAYGIAPASQIDRDNIYQATLWAMQKAFYNLYATLRSPQDLKLVVVDAMPLTLKSALIHPELELHHFNFGESVSPSIAAASIIAKVTRDRLMTEMSTLFPAYGHAKHKGYATTLHRDALQIHGASIDHRLSFCTKVRSNPVTF
jgi:ribonuclease HII